MLNLSKFLPLVLYLAAISALGQSYHVQSITSEDGLISNQVNSVVQDNDGQLWISTLKGLAKYDGLHWHEFPDSLTFPISTDTRLTKLPDGRILAAGHANNDEFVAQIYSSNSVIEIDVPITDFRFKKHWEVTEASGHLYIHLFYNDTIHTYSLDEGTWSERVLPASLHSQVTRLRAFGDELYILSRIGIYKVDGARFDRITPEKYDNVPMIINDMVKTDSTIYILGRKWLGELRGSKFSLLLNHTDQDVVYNYLRINTLGFLFFRTETRFLWYHIPSGDYLGFTADNDDAVPQNSTLYIDKENNLWVTSYRGLHRFNSFQFLGFTPNSGLLEYEVSALEEIAPNKFFIGGHRSYAILENQAVKFRSFSTEKTQGKTRILSISVKKNPKGGNTLYLAAQDLGLGVLRSDGSVSWSPLPAGTAELVFYGNDTLFVSAQTGAIYTFQNGRFTLYTNINGYPRNIYLLSDGTKLICTSSGLRLMKGPTVKSITVTNNVLLRSIYCMFEVGGHYYLGTDAGLARWEGDKIVPTLLFGYSLRTPVYAVRKRNDREIWLGTDNGVVVVTPQGLTDYGDADGLLGTEINRRAFAMSSSGNILVGTNKGLNIYDPKMNFSRPQRFPPEIISLEVGNKTYLFPWDKLKLSATNNNLRINIRSITFSRQSVTFRYRMNGFENEWSTLSSEDLRQVQYRNLPSGSYKFELQSRLGSGVWSKSIVSPSMTISQSFYTSIPFFIIIFLAAVGIGFLVNRIITQFTMNKKLRNTIQSKIQEIEINEARLQLALENSRMGVWTYNFETMQVDHTQQIFEMLNMHGQPGPLTVPEYVGLIHPDDRQELTKSFDTAVKSRQSFEIEMRLQTSGGDYRWMMAKGRCMYHQSGKPQLLSGTLADINDRKQYEADREELILELEQTNRELDRFVYSASHDLSAPMKSVMGLINLARMNASPAEMNNYLSLIDKSIRKQDEFIKEIIAFARNTRTQVEFEQIDLADILEETLSNLRYADHYSKSEFLIDIAENCKSIPGDRTRFKIILNNLLSNAIKFQRKDTDRHIVKVSAAKALNKIEIHIEDNGEGIRDEHRVRIFDMFYRATDNAPGSGLGLYIAREAAEKMGGRIDVESTYGVGSKFTITIFENGHALPTTGKTA